MSDSSELIPVPDDLNMGATIRGYVPGQRLFDRYALDQVLGRGGMGIVWLATDETLERRVALKFLPETLRLDTSALDDLKRETRRGLALAHQNIVRIYDFIDDSTAAAISMEYIDGRTLSALRIEQPGRVFQASQLEVWVTQLIEALDYAHRRAKIVHRDLKPANLMTTLEGELKIADFGIARSISDSVSRVSVKGASSGTLVYMSPQQAQGMPPKASDDIYAFGATLYELLTSKPPFFSGNIQHQLDSVTAPSMTQRRLDLEIEPGEEIPPQWENTVAACLAKDPSERPASIAHIGELLGLRTSATVYATAPTAAPTVVNAKAKTAPAKAEKASPLAALLEHKWLIGAGAGVALLLIGGLGYYYGVAVPAEKARQAQIAQQAAANAAAAAEQAKLEAEKKAAEDALAAQKAADDKAAAEKAAEEKAAADKAAADKAAADLAAAQQAARDAQAAKDAADLKAQQLAAAAAAAAAAENMPERIAHEKEVSTQVQSEIDAKKLGAALYHLDLLIAGISSDRAATLVAPFTATLEPYRQQRDAALTASQSGDPATALAALKTFDTANPGDPKIAMAEASVMTRMPPDHQSLKDELKAMRVLSTGDAAVRNDPNFTALQTKFTNEQSQYETLAGHLEHLKDNVGRHPSVAKLEAQKADAEKKLQGYESGSVATGLVNIFAGSSMSLSSSIADKKAEIAALDEKIAEIQNEPTVTQAAVDDAQQKLDDFIAAVPW